MMTTVRRSMLQNLHLMAPGARARRMCGSPTGAFARVREHEWLRKFVRDGGQFCPECVKEAERMGEDVPAIDQEPKRRRSA